MKELFVHIGVLKTGTTAIQSHFSVYDRLHRCFGFRYPRLGNSPYRNMDVADDIQTATGGFATRSKYLQHLEKSGCRRFLISAEKMFHLPRAPEYFNGFSRSARVRIIIFVRRQDRYMESLYRQLVKNPRPALGIDFGSYVKHRLEAPERRCRHEWRSCLEPWERMFGKDNITIFPYNEYRRVDSISLVADLVGLRFSKRLPSLGLRSGNPSLSAESTVFLRHLRAEKIPFNPRKISDFDRLIPDPSTSFLPASGRKRIMDGFRAENEALGVHYGIDVSPLVEWDEAIESERKVLNPDEIDISELSRLAAMAGLISDE
jgi:hypothetical protein